MANVIIVRMDTTFILVQSILGYPAPRRCKMSGICGPFISPDVLMKLPTRTELVFERPLRFGLYSLTPTEKTARLILIYQSLRWYEEREARNGSRRMA